MIRHNLDVMHIEKNICANILTWLLNPNEKFKHVEVDIKYLRKPKKGKKLRYPNLLPKLRNKYQQLSKQDRKHMCEIFVATRFPDGHASNIAGHVHEDGTLDSSLKSHDFHILLQELLPLALRNLGMPKKMAIAIMHLSNFFKKLCSTSNTVNDFMTLHATIPKVLCELERHMPPSFFVIMSHLPVHLAHEASVAGLVQYRWMYPIER